MKNPHSEKAFYYRGMYRSEYGSSKGAISDFTQAIEIRSKKHTLKQIAAPYYQRGQQYKEIGDKEQEFLILQEDLINALKAFAKNFDLEAYL